MADETVSIRFDGTADGLVAAAKQVSQALGGVTQHTKEMSAGTVAAGVVMGNAFTAMSKKVMQFGKEAMGAFGDVAGEVRKLRGITGGTAEDVSRLAFAAHEVGASSRGVARGFAILSQHLAKNDDVAKKLGVTFKNVDGSMRSPLEVMGQVSDRLNAMGKGAERTALAKQALGRGFIELNPLLLRGSEGMKEFAKQADILGLTMSEKDLEAAKQFKMANKELHAAVKGVFVSIGREVMPTLAAYAGAIAHGVLQIREFFNEHKGLHTAVKVFGVIVGVATGAILQYMAISKGAAAVEAAWAGIKGALGIATAAATTATEAETAAQWSLNAAMEANPIGMIVMAIELLVVAFVGIMKASDTFRNVFSRTMQIVGSVVGYVVAGIILSFRGILDAFTIVIRGAAKMAGWFGKTFHIGWLESAGKGVEGFLNTIDGGLTKAAKAARLNGGKIGRGIGEGIGNAIKNFKLPSFKMPKSSKTEGGFDIGGIDPKGAADALKKQKEAAQKAAEALKEYWTKRINYAKEALDIAKGAAKEAADKMADYSKQISDSVAGAFDITRLTETSFAKYLGAGALVSAFRKKLADTKEFVSDLKALKEQGLPLSMLQQIAGAGVDGGLDAARLLVGNAGAISELQSIQSEIDAQAKSAGELLGTATYGTEVQQKQEAVAPAQTALNTQIQGATDAGLIVTQDTSASGDITISVDVATDADPQDIADAVAFGIKTNTAPVVKPKPKPAKTPSGTSKTTTKPASKPASKPSSGGGARLTYR